MADARSKAVVSAMADLYSRANYGIDLVTQLREPMGRGDIVEVPSISSALTVTSDGSTGASPQAITTSVLSCQANLHPAIFAQMKAIDQMQLVNGVWGNQVAMQAIMMLKSSMDQALCRDYLAQSLCYDTSGTYHDNAAAASLTLDIIVSSIASLLSNDGCMLENLMMMVGPFGLASLQSISEFTYQVSENQSNLGIARVGNVFGVPVYVSNSIANGRTIAATASAIATNVWTITLPAGHGLTPNQKIKTSGGTANVTTATAITSVGATSCTLTFTSGDNATNGALTVTVQNSENLIMDKSHVFVSQQLLPSVRIVPDYESTDDALQVSAIWGRIGRAGRVRVIHSPLSSS